MVLGRWGSRIRLGLGRLRPGRLGRRGVIAVVLVLLATAGAGGWLLTRPSGSPTAQTITATVAAGDFEQTVTATGTVQPTRQADLDFAVSGRVTSVKVQPGDKVEKGEVLARLDRTSLEAALTSAEAQLEAAEAQYDDDLDADASATQLAADTAAVAAAESTLSQAQDDLDAATLTASMTGTVASVDLTVGDQVSGTSPSSDDGSTAPDSSNQNAATSTTSQVVVVSPRLFTVEADVAADDVGDVKKGMQAEVTPTGATEPVFGTVSSVGLVAEVSESGAATFPVTVTITGPQTGLYAGTSANVSVITEQVTDVLSVPTMALHTEGSTTYVEKLVKGKKVRTTVELGETYGASTEVTSGLVTGDKVVIASFRPPTGTTDRGGNNPGGQFPEGGVPRRRRRRSPARRRNGHPPVSLIELEDVRKTYDTGHIQVDALRGVDARIEEGEYVAVVGPSGSGKSTLMHILGCLDVPTSGSYHLAGEDVSQLSENRLAEVRNRRIGFVFQQFNLLASLPAWRNVELPLVYAGVSRHERKERAMAALEKVSLSDRAQHRPGELSGGQQQRVAVARALVTDPALILADEPTGNLDSASTRDMLGLLDDLSSLGRTIVLITHEHDVAARAGRTLSVDDGRVVAT